MLMDVKNVFLQGDHEEEVYIMSHHGFHDMANNSKVCKLKKVIYGLKQSPRT